MRPGQRACIVCTTKTSSEGQLCAACVEAGCSVDDNNVYVALNIDLPPSLRDTMGERRRR